jgi:CheY-like chemotaxis protein
MARRLRRWGADTETVSGTDAADALLKQQKWHAVLIDQAMGTAAAGALARISQHIERRIVMIAPADRPHLSELKEAGFTGYLVKPIRAASLAARLVRQEETFDPAPSTVTASVQRTVNAAANGLSILVAEDNEINALLTRVLLQKLGHRPMIVTDGAEAIDAWIAAHESGDSFDLVLMDVHMPRLSGIEATTRIRARVSDDTAQSTPILALTANAFPEDRDACLAAGMNGFLVKPLDRERLAAALDSIVSRRSIAA